MSSNFKVTKTVNKNGWTEYTDSRMETYRREGNPRFVNSISSMTKSNPVNRTEITGGHKTKSDVFEYLRRYPDAGVLELGIYFDSFTDEQLTSIINDFNYSLFEVEPINETENKKPRVALKKSPKTASKKQPSPKAIAPKQNYRYSFSGADCNVFARVRSTSRMIHLDSVSTVSVSIYEAKAPVRRLGHASPVGFTGNIRTVAGSIICVLRDNHPLSEMMQGNFHTKHLDDSQIRDNGKENFNSGALFPFDLMLMYKNEVGDALGFSIYNVEIISEGIVTSTNDMITEVVLQFQATHIDQIEKVKPIKAPEPKVKKSNPLPSVEVKYAVINYNFTLYGIFRSASNAEITFENDKLSADSIAIDELGNIVDTYTLFSYYILDIGLNTIGQFNTKINIKNFTLEEAKKQKNNLIADISAKSSKLTDSPVKNSLNNYEIIISKENKTQTDVIDFNELLSDNVRKTFEYKGHDITAIINKIELSLGVQEFA